MKRARVQPGSPTPARARDHRRQAAVLQLQRAAGNAATTRLIGAARRSIARFGEPEHKAIGDAALNARFRLPGSRLFKELELTFGDFVALGDWFEDIEDVRKIMRGEALAGEDRVDIVKRDKSGNYPSTIGQLHYAVLVKIRPKSKKEADDAEKAYMDTLFNKADKDAVEERYGRLKTRNIKHFPNPLVGDEKLSTAEKAKRTKDGKPLGAIAQYRASHLEAIGLAISAGQLGDERLHGEAVAMDGFACHFLTDMFSGSHTRTPRSSIEAYWDKKVPAFDDKLVKWLADEVVKGVHHDPDGWKQWLGVTVLYPFNVVRGKARQQIRKVVPELSFGDVVGLVIHDWEGAHGKDLHGPLVEVAGQRLRLVGDERLMPALRKFAKPMTDKQLKGELKNTKGKAADRTFAAATLAVKASVGDVEQAFDLAKKKRKRKDIVASLMGKDGLFAPERYIPKPVPDAKQPAEDRAPRWDFATLDGLLADPKFSQALLESGPKVAAPFKDTIKTLDASQSVKDQLERAVVKPLNSGDVKTIRAWIRAVAIPRPAPRSDPRQDLVDVMTGMH